MKYYIIVGEASGDLHASHLMKALKNIDKESQFRFFGGDNMKAVGGTLVKHYREMAYMGFVPVLLHFPTILKNMAICKKDILEWKPDAVIVVDYPSFNLRMAEFVHTHSLIPVYYYISPKIWAWKEYRIRSIRRNVDEVFSILPFEVPFFEEKHHYPIHYIGNPTADEVKEFLEHNNETFLHFCQRNNLSDKPIIALLAGSRQQEIKDNLPTMMRVAEHFTDYQFVLAGAPSIDDEYYDRFLKEGKLGVVRNETFALLHHATAALVTSGTATLEAALLNVPQVVCYKTPLPHLISFLKKHFLKVKYISLVNLIADREVVAELVAASFGEKNMIAELGKILPGQEGRTKMLEGYAEVRQAIGKTDAPGNAAKIINRLLHVESEECHFRRDY
ncbi:MAG: lipid-A-disaccharide synthase [Prevotella sp.]|nr:lipid-A-disaccharide synthase [Prevotella sp.]